MAGSTRPYLALAAAVLLFLSGAQLSCGDCAGVGQPAVRITVVDINSGTNIADGATLYIFSSGSSTLIDSVTGRSQDQSLAAAYDRTGRFDLVIEREGYYPWTAQRVAVGGSCTVQTEIMTAQLRPRSP